MSGERWRLRYFQDVDGQPTFVRDMVSIGPRLTQDPRLAATFASEQEARRHPAAAHPTCLCDPEPAEDTP